MAATVSLLGAGVAAGVSRGVGLVAATVLPSAGVGAGVGVSVMATALISGDGVEETPAVLDSQTDSGMRLDQLQSPALSRAQKAATQTAGLCKNLRIP